MDAPFEMALLLVVFGILTIGAAEVYQWGYNQAKKDLAAQWYEGPEGFCLSDRPQHIGACHDVP